MICIKFFGDQPSTMNPLDVESDVGEKTRVIDHYFRENLLIHVIFIKIWENHIFISFISMFFPFIYHYDIIFPRQTMGFPRLHHGFSAASFCFADPAVSPGREPAARRRQRLRELGPAAIFRRRTNRLPQRSNWTISIYIYIHIYIYDNSILVYVYISNWTIIYYYY